MAVPNSVFLGSCLAYLMLVLHLSAAPLSVVTPEVARPNAVSPAPSSSPLPHASSTEATTPSTEQPKTTDAPPTAVPQVTEDVFSSDEAIRHLPAGYWIKRPSASSASSAAVGGTSLTSEDEDSGEAQESFIDYRTERYQIADLFPAASSSPPSDTLARETLQHDRAAPAGVQPGPV